MEASDFGFGKPDAAPADRRLEVTLQGLENASGVLTFQRSESGFADGYSTWNFDSDNGVMGAGDREVPPRTVHLVARGKVGDVERWMECIYYRPPFPDGMVATGPIDAKSVRLSAIRSPRSYSGGEPSGIPQEDLMPANVFSNALTGLDDAPVVLLRGESRVSGNVGAKGTVTVIAPSVVAGEVLPGSEERAVPDLRLEEKFALVEESSGIVTSTPGDLVLDKNWFSRSEGTLTVGGDLDMNGTALLVKNGDLKVRGGIKGHGIILSEGNVEIHDGRTNLDTSDLIAVGCKGDFILRAEAPESNYFRGLIYSESSIEAKDITVVGGMVCHGKDDATGSIKLDNVRFVHDPTSLDIVVFPLMKARRWNENRDRYEYAAFWVLLRLGLDPDNPSSELGWILDAGACMQTQGPTGPRYEQSDQIKSSGPPTTLKPDGRVAKEKDFTDPFLLDKTIAEWKASSPATYRQTSWRDVWCGPQSGESSIVQQKRIVAALVGKESGPPALVRDWFDDQSGLSGGDMDSWDTNIWQQGLELPVGA